jgi:hypothetical protein
LNWNFSPPISISEAWHSGSYWINCDAEFKMEIDNQDDELNAKKFRDYAAQCRRMAQAASEKDRVVLIEIAEAWAACADEAERKRSRKH